MQNHYPRYGIAGCAFMSILTLVGVATIAAADESLKAYRLPNSTSPVMCVWGMMEHDFTSDHFEKHIDMMAEHSGANVLATTIRAPERLVTNQDVRDRVKRAVEHAAKYGIGIAMDLDVRLAREAFAEKYPDELQQMLRLREVTLKVAGEVTVFIPYDRLSDHYTYESSYNIPNAGRLLRVYAYERTDKGIKPHTVQDITASCQATPPGEAGITVSIPCNEQTAGRTACVMTSFEYLVADVFGPHVISFQQQILESYRDILLAGACKDEWGFPPCLDGNPAHNDYWYSRHLAAAYAEQTGGRDFIRDCLLMTCSEVGREAERLLAINQFNDLCRQRNAKIENEFYAAVKAIWGRDAVVATHPTWWPYPDRREMKKNGLDWWLVKRDYAQTDEITPYCVRTALAKKLNSPVWYNMYYSPEVADYQAEMWAGALTGGRIDYHPLWPVDLNKVSLQERYGGLLRDGLMRGDCRIRLLNFITRSQLDCPVAIVFGQPCAMNWAGPDYDDVGIELTDALWKAGFPADLIPTSEIWTGSLTVSDDGYVQYGPQRYRVAVLYHPDYDKPVTAELFRKAAKGKTTLFRMGQWKHNYHGMKYDVSTELPADMSVLDDPKTAVRAIINKLKAAGVQRQPLADRLIGFGDCRTAAPPASGHSRLLDGTHVIASGKDAASGVPIIRTISVDGHDVNVDAVGLVAVRFDKQGDIEALAVGGLKILKAGNLSIELPERADIALWRDNQGKFHGAIQDYKGDVPEVLLRLTGNWLRLSVPVPME